MIRPTFRLRSSLMVALAIGLLTLLFGGVNTLSAATLLADFDASLGVNTAGSSVNSWADQVGGAGVRDATPVGGTVAPVLESNVFAGGQPGIRFDGGDSVLAFSDAGFPNGTNSYTLVAAWKADTLGQSGGGFSRPTIAGYGPGGVNHQDGAHLAIRPDENTHPAQGLAIHRTNGGDQNFGGVPPSETGTFPVTVNTPYVQIISKISETDLTGTLITPDGILSGTDTGLNPAESQVQLGSGHMGNMLSPGPGDFNESRFTGWIGRLQIYEGVLDAGELSSVIAQMTSYVTGGTPPAPPSTFTWNADASGDWNSNSNWTETSFAPPNNPNHTAIFGDVITQDRLVFNEAPVTVNRIEFNNTSARYVVAGTNAVNLAATTAPTPDNPSMSVVGTHEFQAPVSLDNDTAIDVSSDSVLTFNNALSLNGFTATKTGTGGLAVNNLLSTGGGLLDIQEGTLSGNGAVGGDVINDGGTLSPGSSVQTASSIPEPTSLGLLLLGALLMLVKRSRMA